MAKTLERKRLPEEVRLDNPGVAVEGHPNHANVSLVSKPYILLSRMSNFDLNDTCFDVSWICVAGVYPCRTKRSLRVSPEVIRVPARIPDRIGRKILTTLFPNSGDGSEDNWSASSRRACDLAASARSA